MWNLLKGILVGSLLGGLVMSLLLREKPRSSRTLQQLAPKLQQEPDLGTINDPAEYLDYLWTLVPELIQPHMTELEAKLAQDAVCDKINAIAGMEELIELRKINQRHRRVDQWENELSDEEE